MKALGLLGMAAIAIGCSTGRIGASDGSDPSNPGPGTTPGNPTDEVRLPIGPRVTRLTDRQLSNAIRDLLGLDHAPVIETTSGGREEFIPSHPAAVNGGVALELRDLVESVSAGAAIKMAACVGDERACATALIERFGKRAFRRPLDDAEKTALVTVYDSGRTNYGAHVGGVRLVIEAVLQAPSFLYVPELGEKLPDGELKLSAYEHATKLALFLLDSVADDDLWAAAEDGTLATEAGLDAQIDRLFAKPEVKANVSKIFVRMFQLDRLPTIAKDASITEFNPTSSVSLPKARTRSPTPSCMTIPKNGIIVLRRPTCQSMREPEITSTLSSATIPSSVSSTSFA